MILQPSKIQRLDEDRLMIEWDDGVKQEILNKELRANCPCAFCKGEDPPIPLGPKSSEPQRNINNDSGNIQIVSMRPVGNYAYEIVFSDGHDTGIYTFDHLRKLGKEIAQ